MNGSISTALTKLLADNGISLIVTSRRDHAVWVFDATGVRQMYVRSPYGVAVLPGSITVASDLELWSWKDDGAGNYTEDWTIKPAKRLWAHDLASVGTTLYMTASHQNAIITIDGRRIRTLWTPPFIDTNVLSNQCNLNGVAIRDAAPRYVSMFTQRAGDASWREGVINQGAVWDITTNAPVVTNLTAPHSPRFIGGTLYVCDSGRGTILKGDTVLATLPGFTRGLCSVAANTLVVGTSLSNLTAAHGEGLPIDDDAHNVCGLYAVNATTGDSTQLHVFEYAREVHDVQVIHHPTVTLAEFYGASG
jgi:uncharacterized protein (TIGR03032 family)